MKDKIFPEIDEYLLIHKSIHQTNLLLMASLIKANELAMKKNNKTSFFFKIQEIKIFEIN